MTITRKDPPLRWPIRTVADFTVGQQVWVYADQNFRHGVVTKLGRTRVSVSHPRNLRGAMVERPYPMDRIVLGQGEGFLWGWGWVNGDGRWVRVRPQARTSPQPAHRQTDRGEAMTLDEFLTQYAPDPKRVVLDIEVPAQADGETPFIVLRYGDYTMVVNPMGLRDHLCVDVHPFINGQAANVAAMGMTQGVRHSFPTGDLPTSHGWPAVAMLSALLGAQVTGDATAPPRQGVVAAVLTEAQQAAVDHYRALNVPASWFVGVPDQAGSVEVLAMGDTFVWSFRIDPQGEVSSSEAPLGEFSTGIDC